MRYYELITIVPTRYTDAEVEGIVGRIRELVGAHGAAVAQIQNLGKVRFAYPIRGERFGNYIRFIFQGEPEHVAALRDGLRLLGEVLRATITGITPAVREKPVQLAAYQEPIPASERERDDRPRLPRAPRRAPPVVAAKPITEEELEKQIDKIIEEKVL